jgi:hypothetical protein
VYFGLPLKTIDKYFASAVTFSSRSQDDEKDYPFPLAAAKFLSSNFKLSLANFLRRPD